MQTYCIKTYFQYIHKTVCHSSTSMAVLGEETGKGRERIRIKEVKRRMNVEKNKYRDMR